MADQFPVAPPVAYVASGSRYPDGLAGGALAGHQGVPLLLSAGSSLSPETAAALTRLEPASIVVLGGSSTISDQVLADLDALTPGPVSRVSGANRYDTAAQIAQGFPVGPDRVYLASGVNYPDALTASSLAASQGVPLLLSAPSTLPRETRDAVTTLGAASGVVLGGASTVQSIVMDQLGALVD